jgi:hypothetical protein
MKIHRKNISRGFLIALFVLVLAAGAVIAQQQLAVTDTGIFEDQPSNGINGEQVPAGAGVGSYDTGRGDPMDGPAPDDNPAPGSPTSSRQGISPSAVSSTFWYYQVSGATLRGRSSTTAYLYDGVGCVHLTAGSSTTLILNTEAHIPDNSVIKYIRLYYRDTSGTQNVRAYLTRYSPGVASVDLISTSSTAAFSSGYGFVVSEELTETVNNNTYAYTLIGWPSAADVNLQICGIRVAYYAPLATVAFLPTISK